MRGRRAALALLLAAGLLGPAAPSGAAPSKTYEPPFAIGPAGGDSRGYASAEPEGRVTVARAYPMIGPISCPGGGAYATLVAQHAGKAPVRSLTASYTDALVDPYVYVTVGVRDATGRWLGSRKTSGAQGSGEIVVPVRWDRTVRPPLQVHIGLELSTACPHADAGTLRFTRVTVRG